MKRTILAIAMVFTVALNAQTKEELEAQIATKKDSIAALTGPIQGRVDALQAQIDGMPGWRTGAFGTIGVACLTLTTGLHKVHQTIVQVT